MGREVQRIQDQKAHVEEEEDAFCMEKDCNLPHHCLEQDHPVCDLPGSILSSCFTPWSLPHSLAPWPEERGIGESS